MGAESAPDHRAGATHVRHRMHGIRTAYGLEGEGVTGVRPRPLVADAPPSSDGTPSKVTSNRARSGTSGDDNEP